MEIIARAILVPNFDFELVESFKVFNRNDNGGADGIKADELMEILNKFDYHITLKEE